MKQAKLDRTEIAEQALQLLNEVGLDQLTTRALAARLNIKQPALYWHFKTKQDLWDAMNAAMLAKHHRQRLPRPGEHWRDYIADNARSFHRTLLAYRDGARLHVGRRSSAADLMWAEARLGHLAAAGFAPETASQGMMALWRFNVGCVLEQQAEARPAEGADRATIEQFPLVAAAVRAHRDDGPDALFERGMAMILDGMESSLSRPQDAAKPRGRQRSQARLDTI